MDLFIILVIFLIPSIAQINISNNYSYYKRVSSKAKLTGQEVARKLLKKYDLEDIYVVEVGGELSDHYDSERRVVRLSKDIYHGTSLASISVAAHEVGHAIQDKEHYSFFQIRHLIYPVVSLATNCSYFIILIGLLMEALKVVYIGIGLTAFGLIFQLVTLPVEFDASKRALGLLQSEGILSSDEIEGARKMLGSAAMTYVAGVIASVAQILRLIMIYGKKRD